MRIAYLTSRDMVPGSAGTRGDLWELEAQLGEIGPAAEARGFDLELTVWEDPDLDVSTYDAVVIGTPWDYTQRVDAFLARIDAFGESVPVLNPPATVRWNAHKSYLKELAAKGVPSIPTVWGDRCTQSLLDEAFERFGCTEVVVKAVVGAGAAGQLRIGRGERVELPAWPVMVQPFLPSAATEGEYSLLYFDRQYSHATLKRAAKGDYRIQSLYGGTEHVHRPTQAELRVAEAVLARVPGDLLYARVDLLRLPDGGLALIELELIEPYLYPQPGMGERFAAALGRLLG